MVTARPQVVELPVSPNDAQALAAALEQVIHELPLEALPFLYLSPFGRHALAVSFDKRYRPFLGFTSGWNDPDRRAMVTKGCNLLVQIAELVEGLGDSIPGGRVFLGQYAASKIVDGLEHTLCVYDWPGDGPLALAKQAFQRRCDELLPAVAAP